MTDRRKDLQRFEELERLAQDWLGKPQLLLPELGRAALRLWQADQQSRTCWLLCKNWKSPSGLADEPAMLRKAVWHRAADFERFRDPLVGGRLGLHLRPTVSYQDAEVSSELVIELLDSLHACSVQLSRCTTLHLGWGVNRAVDAGTEWPSFRFAWSHNPPPPIGWEALDRWFSQAWARIEAQT